MSALDFTIQTKVILHVDLSPQVPSKRMINMTIYFLQNNLNIEYKKTEVSQLLKSLIPLFMRGGYFTQGLLRL